METSPDETKARFVRRWLFWGWVAITAAAAIYVGALAPIAVILDMQRTLATVIVPPIVILLGGVASIWLILYVLIPPTADSRNTGTAAVRSGP